MKVIGEGSIHIYQPEDEVPHEPGEGELWQESFVIYFWDTEQQVYSFLRMSQVPNKNGGTATVWLNLWTPDYQYKHTDDSLKLGEQDRQASSLTVGKGLCRYEYDGKHNWQVNDEDISISFCMEDHHPGMGYFGNDEKMANAIAKSHIETTGYATGTITIKDKTYQVAGTAWRDHSWGFRHWPSVKVHRAYHSVFGKEASVFCLSIIGADKKLSKVGMVIRGEDVQFVNDFTITAFMDEDGISNCGGNVEIKLNDEILNLNYTPLAKAAISMIDGFPCVDTMCRVTMDNMIGVGFSETSNNAQDGITEPTIYPSSAGIIDNGIFSL